MEVESLALQMNVLAQDIISSYEDRLTALEGIFNGTHELLAGFQNALFETREERNLLSSELREKLAKTESLRRKDFDQMMRSILAEQEAREKEVRELLKKYLAEQREVSQIIKETLSEFNQKLLHGEQIRIEEYKKRIAEIKEQQIERQNQVVGMLKDFQNKVQEYKKGNEELAQRIKELLEKGETIRIRDFKAMLKEFQKERIMAKLAWQNLSSAMAEKRAQVKEVVVSC